MSHYCAVAFIALAILMAIRGASLPSARYVQQNMASLLVDLESQARGITFYGSVASFSQHLTCYLEPHNRFYSNCVALMLLSGYQETLIGKQPSF